MKRINVGFYNDTLEKIQVRMEKKGLKSQADCIRELVELGLKIEEAAEKNAGQETGEDMLLTLLGKIDMYMQISLKWALETRLLTRYTVGQFPKEIDGKQVPVLGEYKEKAINHIKKITTDVAELQRELHSE
jgi:hypothetical protein